MNEIINVVMPDNVETIPDKTSITFVYDYKTWKEKDERIKKTYECDLSFKAKRPSKIREYNKHITNNKNRYLNGFIVQIEKYNEIQIIKKKILRRIIQNKKSDYIEKRKKREEKEGFEKEDLEFFYSLPARKRFKQVIEKLQQEEKKLNMEIVGYSYTFSVDDIIKICKKHKIPYKKYIIKNNNEIKIKHQISSVVDNFLYSNKILFRNDDFDISKYEFAPEEGDIIKRFSDVIKWMFDKIDTTDIRPYKEKMDDYVNFLVKISSNAMEYDIKNDTITSLI